MAALLPQRARVGRLSPLAAAALAVAAAAAHAAGPPQAPPPDPAEVRALARAGAPGLALRLALRAAPAPEPDPGAWAVWEVLRLELLAAAGRWEALLERTARLPAAAGPELRRHALTLRARALLARGRPAEARALLRRLIWSGEAPPAAALARWRRLVVECYAAEGRREAAVVALRRLRQDLGPGDALARTATARLLLALGRPAEAHELLEGVEGEEAAVWRLLAALRAGAAAPAAVRKRAAALAAREGPAPRLRAAAWRVAAEAAARAGDAAGRIRALEAAVAAAPPLGAARARAEGADPFGRPVLAALWAAWEEAAAREANARGLLVGDDAAWLALAREGEAAPALRRALLAWLVRHAGAQAVRAAAAEALAVALAALPGGEGLLGAVFLDPARFPAPAALPPAVRYRAAGAALAAGRVRLASRVLAGLDRPPPGVDATDWRLRRARVLVLGGRPREGAEALRALLAGEGPWPASRYDRLMQVVFDLQAAGGHREALAVLAAAGPRVPDARRARERWYWMADSWRGLGEHVQAARLYLRSALAAAGGLDPWGRSARYRAAESLAAAGLREDAARQYRALLAVTKDPARRALLAQALARLGAAAAEAP